MKTKNMTYMEAIRETIREEMKKDEFLFMIGEDVGPYGGEMGLSQGLWTEFGDKRMRDAPISEATIIGCALGASLTGCRAIAEIPFCDFMGECMDQIYNQVAKMRYIFGGKAKIPLVIRTPIGGYQGGAAQHSQCLEAWFTHTPGLKIVMPSTATDAKGLLRTALNDSNPVLFFEHKNLYHIKEEVPDDDYTIPFGKANIKRQGKDLTIIATSYMVKMSLDAAVILAQEGIEAEVVDPRTLVPLDEETLINSVKKTGKVLIVYEAWKRLGAGSEIASLLAEKAFPYLKAPILRVAAENVPIPFSPVLENFVLPNKNKIVKGVKKLLGKEVA
jgi:pyruvate dehydrogenase E1 component beta subunit